MCGAAARRLQADEALHRDYVDSSPSSRTLPTRCSLTSHLPELRQRLWLQPRGGPCAASLTSPRARLPAEQPCPQQQPLTGITRSPRLAPLAQAHRSWQRWVLWSPPPTRFGQARARIAARQRLLQARQSSPPAVPPLARSPSRPSPPSCTLGLQGKVKATMIKLVSTAGTG